MKPVVIPERKSSAEGTASSRPQDGSGFGRNSVGKVQAAKGRVEGKKRNQKNS